MSIPTPVFLTTTVWVTHMACNGFTHVRTSKLLFFGASVVVAFAVLTRVNTGGGQPISHNRTKWPVKGGAIGIQPGWFSGHATAFFYINLGEGNIPSNYSLPMVPVFQITGPSNNLYPGSICLAQVPLPANFTAVVGNNATIQVIETAQHGAALYNVGLPNEPHLVGR